MENRIHSHNFRKTDSLKDIPESPSALPLIPCQGPPCPILGGIPVRIPVLGQYSFCIRAVDYFSGQLDAGHSGQDSRVAAFELVCISGCQKKLCRPVPVKKAVVDHVVEIDRKSVFCIIQIQFAVRADHRFQSPLSEYPA